MPDQLTDAATRAPGVPRTYTEEQIQAYSLEPIEPLTGPITFVEYDRAWPALFNREEARIRCNVDPVIAVNDHPVGSAAICHGQHGNPSMERFDDRIFGCFLIDSDRKASQSVPESISPLGRR